MTKTKKSQPSAKHVVVATIIVSQNEVTCNLFANSSIQAFAKEVFFDIIGMLKF